MSERVTGRDLEVLSDSARRPRDEICTAARIDDQDPHWMLIVDNGVPCD